MRLIMCALLLLLAVSVAERARIVVVEIRPSQVASTGVEDNLNLVQRVLKSVEDAVDSSAPSNLLLLLSEYGVVNDLYLDPININTRQKLTAACNWFNTVYRRQTRGNPLCTRIGCTETPEGGPAGRIWELAKKFGVKISVNLLTKFDRELYNVQFVFGEEGREAYYQKQKPVPAERASRGMQISAGTEAGLWQANWDRKAKFGILVCFDIIFPAAQRQARSGVKYFMFPTEWDSKQELYSLGVQQAFSRITRTYLFAANINGVRSSTDPLTRTGSSIIRAGRVRHFHVGQIPSVRGDGAFAHIMHEDVNFAKDPDQVDDPDLLFDDSPALYNGEGPTREKPGRSATATRFYRPNDEEVEEKFVLDAGDLQCVFKFDPDQTVRGGDDVGYVLRAQNGMYAGRNIRTCTILAVETRYDPTAKANKGKKMHTKWNRYNLNIPYRFHAVSIKSNVHGNNVATLPIVVLMHPDNQTPMPVEPEESTFKVVKDDDSKTRLTVTPPVGTPLAIMSVYGVVGDEQLTRVDIDDDMEAVLPETGDTTVNNLAVGDDTVANTCPADAPAFLDLKQRFGRKTPAKQRV